MEKIRAHSFLLFWSLTGLAAMITIWFLPWRFSTNDDEIMMWLVSGAYTGTPESYAVFIHPLLSWIFSKLYTVFPAIPWYPLTWFGLMLGAYIAWLVLVWKKTSKRLVLHIWSLFLFAFLIHFSFFLQFSIVAAFAVSAALLARILKKDGSKFQMNFYWTDLLLFLGFLIRFEVPFLIIAGILCLNFLIQERRIFTALIMPTLFLGVCWGLTQLWIHQQGLGEFQDLNKLRSEVFDDPALQLMKERFKEEDSELYFFANGLIDYQNDDLTLEKLKVWKERLNQDRFKLYQPKWIFQSFWTFLEHEWFFIGIILSFLIFGIGLFRIKMIYLISSLFLITLLLSPFYLLKVQIFAILFLTLFSASFLIAENSRYQSHKFLSSLFCLLIIGLLIHFKSFVHSKANLISSIDLDQSIRRLKADNSFKIYLIGGGEILRDYRFSKNLPFKFLGWPTFLENDLMTASSKTAYLVEKETYLTYQDYFKKYGNQQLISDDYILVVLK
jgi:MFS family permease